MKNQFKKNAEKKKAGCGVRIRPIFRVCSYGDYLRVPFLATGDVFVVVDIGFVAGLTAVVDAGAAVVAAGLVAGAAPVVVVVGSGSFTGVIGVVGFGTGFEVTVAMYASRPSFLLNRPS